MPPEFLGLVSEYWWVAPVVTTGALVVNKMVQLIVGVLALRKADSKDVPAVVRALARWGKK